MKQFRKRPGATSAVHLLKKSFPDIMAFNTVVQSLITTNPLGCTPYWMRNKNNPPIAKVREMFTAKFVYENAEKKRIGSGTEVYDSIDGFQYGIASVITNMANVAAHGGKVRHVSGSDHFSVILKCHDLNGEFYFLSLARDRVTLSNYKDDEIRARVEEWSGSVSALE
jgi:hypothetical protein